MTCAECQGECLSVAVVAEGETLRKFHFCPKCYRAPAMSEAESQNPTNVVVQLSPEQMLITGEMPHVPDYRRAVVENALLHLGSAFRHEKYAA